MNVHIYTDNTQLYIVLEPDDPNSLNHLTQCIENITDLICNNYLKLNKDKKVIVGDSKRDKILSRLNLQQKACLYHRQ